MASLGGGPPILHLHLSGRCNLACRHCYSESGPERPDIANSSWRGWIATGARLGFPIVSLTGGEPMLSPDLFDLADAARAEGLRCRLVTNGTLVTARNAARIAAAFERVTVSLDGAEAAHNDLRGSPTAFARARRGLELLAEAGAEVGVAMTVTPETMTDLAAVAEVAHDAGARFLQFRPLEDLGRAAGEGGLSEPDIQALALKRTVLQHRWQGRVAIRADVIAAEVIATRAIPGEPPANAAEALGALIVSERGEAMPLAYGVAGSWTRRTADSAGFATDAVAWLDAGGAEDLRRLVCAAGASAVAEDWPYVNWYDLLRRSSHRHQPGRPFAQAFAEARR